MGEHVVEKIIDFCAGHRLINYKGKCQYLHGHNYKAHIGIAAKELDDKGMVVDFSEIKKIVKGFIDKFWDHSLLLHKDDPLLKVLLKNKQKIFVMAENPTAEAMSKHLYMVAQAHFNNIKYVKIEETPTGICTYYG